MKIIVIGGGPIGVEAALYAVCAGCEVQLFERGALCANVRSWRHVGLFTEWGRNRSPLATRLLTEKGLTLPDANTTSTGEELADYVAQIAALDVLHNHIHCHSEVVSITRERTLKSDLYNETSRGHNPFRLLIRDNEGERIEHADIVIDATGVYSTPNPMGNGGAMCVGESALRSRIDYALPDVTGHDRARFAGRHTLIIGSGHSAASTLRSIAELFTDTSTRISWMVRRNVPSHGFPYTLNPNDSSPHREALHRRANELSRHPNVQFLPRTVVEAVEYWENKFRVTISTKDDNGVKLSVINCDNIACHTGFRADTQLWRELQVIEHPATGGPFSLAETILEANRRAGVGLSTGYAEKAPALSNASSSTRAECDDAPVIELGDARNNLQLLHLGEPNFYVIGIKSYGRDAGFLMQNGFRQVRDVFKLIAGNDQLDLYEGQLD